MSLRIFIVDDEAPARSRMVTLLSDIAVECPNEVVGEAASAQSAMERIAECKPDIVLLDIQMPGMSGIELAMHLIQNETPPILIFVTAYDEYALKAFEVHALDYLLKPVRAARLADALRRATAMCATRISQRQALAETASDLGVRRQTFSIQERGRMLLVPVTDVLYFRAELKYVTLRTKTREFVLEESLLSLEEEMGDQFVRVHRNTLVACNAIRGVERGMIDSEPNSDKAQETWQVILRDIDERLPISRRQWPIVKALVSKRG